jgi:hypothetical protein
MIAERAYSEQNEHSEFRERSGPAIQMHAGSLEMPFRHAFVSQKASRAPCKSMPGAGNWHSGMLLT